MACSCCTPPARIDLVEPSPEQARIRYEELVRATHGVEGARALAGYRQIRIGGLTINVIARVPKLVEVVR